MTVQPAQGTVSNGQTSQSDAQSVELQGLQAEIANSVRGLSAEQTQLHPKDRPTAWSIQQILEHLMLTYELAGRAFEERLAKERPSLRLVTRKQRFIQWLLLSVGYFPSGRTAPEGVLPDQLNLPPMPGAELAEETRRRLAVFDRLATRAETAFGQIRSINHMVLGLLSVPQWRRFQVVHGRHHLKQIARIRADYGI